MMSRKVSRIILSFLILMLTMSNIVYAQPTRQQTIPYGPKVGDLKGREEIIKNLQKLKIVRANLVTINITENTTNEELQSINKDLDYYLEQFNIIRRDLENHKRTYKDSFSDLFFAEQISFVVDSFIISIRQQQILIKSLETDRENAKKLFYSNYLIPVYYYLTLGDQTIAYIENYFLIA